MKPFTYRKVIERTMEQTIVHQFPVSRETKGLTRSMKELYNLTDRKIALRAGKT